MSALGNGSQFSVFKSDAALPATLPTATDSGPVQINMQSKSVGGRSRRQRSHKKSMKSWGGRRGHKKSMKSWGGRRGHKKSMKK
jgi:hypothetical protein